jgi:hypothetical protein
MLGYQVLGFAGGFLYDPPALGGGGVIVAKIRRRSVFNGEDLKT